MKPFTKKEMRIGESFWRETIEQYEELKGESIGTYTWELQKEQTRKQWYIVARWHLQQLAKAKAKLKKGKVK